jgi:hypothetical protein
MFHGPVHEALPFFASLGFNCPVRKDPASFLQEVTTPKGTPPCQLSLLALQSQSHPSAWSLPHCVNNAVFSGQSRDF